MRDLRKLRVKVALAALALPLACSAGGASNDEKAEPGRSGTGGNGGTGGGSGGSGGVSIIGGSGGATGDAGLEGCARARVQSDLLPANILFVLDRTGTMGCNPPPITTTAECEATPVRKDPNQDSKWEIVSRGLKAVFQQLPATASAGLSYFSVNDLCGVTSVPALAVKPLDAAQLAALDMTLAAVPPPKGGTPLVGATVLAFKYLHQRAQLTGNKFVVLVIDGEDNCDKDKLPTLPDEISKALSVNIRTFVIGVPGSEPARKMLSEMAFRGGTSRASGCDHQSASADKGDCHFDMTTTQDFSKDLSAALASISSTALTCEFAVPPTDAGRAVDLSRVNVDYTNGAGTKIRVLQDAKNECAQASGWQYSPDKSKIVLCGSACEQVKNDPKAVIDIVLGCPSEVS